LDLILLFLVFLLLYILGFLVVYLVPSIDRVHFDFLIKKLPVDDIFYVLALIHFLRKFHRTLLLIEQLVLQLLFQRLVLDLYLMLFIVIGKLLMKHLVRRIPLISSTFAMVDLLNTRTIISILISRSIIHGLLVHSLLFTIQTTTFFLYNKVGPYFSIAVNSAQLFLLVGIVCILTWFHILVTFRLYVHIVVQKEQILNDIGVCSFQVFHALVVGLLFKVGIVFVCNSVGRVFYSVLVLLVVHFLLFDILY